jgi:hypothetical protein
MSVTEGAKKPNAQYLGDGPVVRLPDITDQAGAGIEHVDKS